MNYKILVLLAVACFAAVIFLAIVEQHVSSHPDSIVSWVMRGQPPSVALNKVARLCVDLFKYIGRKLSVLCSFLLQLRDFLMEYLKKFWPCLKEILVPIFEIITSPCYVVVGYFQQTMEYVASSFGALFWYTLGSMILVLFGSVAIGYGCYYYFYLDTATVIANGGIYGSFVVWLTKLAHFVVPL